LIDHSDVAHENMIELVNFKSETLQVLGSHLVILGFSSELDKQVLGRWLRKFLWLDVKSGVTFQRIIEVIGKTKAIIDQKEAIIAITIAVPSLCTFLHGS